MKFIPSKLALISLLILISFVVSSHKKGKSGNLKSKTHKSHHKKQVNVVIDATKGFGSDVGVVVRKTPTISVNNKLGLPLLEPPQQFNTFTNSNTSSLPTVGGYGRSAEIVNPTILFHDSHPITLVKRTPAHLGYRDERTTISSFNKESGRVESNDIIQRKPIYGEIESVKTAKVNSIKQLDLQYRRFRAQKNIVQDNPEFQFSRNERFISE